MSKGSGIAILIALSLSATACRVKIPTAAENEALLQRGTFVGEVPAWASQGAALGSRRSSISMGMMPTSYSSTTNPNSTIASSSNFDKTIVEKKAEDYERKKKTETSESESAQNSNQTGQKEKGPLDRIANLCPELEKQTTDALTTVDRKIKVRKFEALANRCQQSADLWYWLGAEYYALSRLNEAEKSINTAISLLSRSGTPEQPEARALLTKIKAKQQELTRSSKSSTEKSKN